MREITLKEMQHIELQILREFDRVCSENDLRYYLDGGTLLGAVCYDGFIPWDDDIDVKMPRPDYERLLSLRDAFSKRLYLDVPCKNHCEFTFIKLIDKRTVLKEYGDFGVKTTGVYIDILPMDGHPDEDEKCKKHFRTLSRLNTLFHASLDGFINLQKSSSLINRVKGSIYNMVYSPWRLYQLLTKTAKKYSYDAADRVGLLVEGDPKRERFEKKWLEPPAILTFEGYGFPAPNESEKHLSIFYQKPISRELYYQNLPYIPSAHSHEVFWRDDKWQE